MSDPFDTLKHLDEGLSVHPLPAAEVRRRGERMRHRRTALQVVGTAAAVAAVLGLGVAVTGTRPGATPAPGPATQAPSQSVSPTGPATTIPADFPLDAGLSGHATPSPGDGLRSPLALDPCAATPQTATDRGRTDYRELVDLVAGTHWHRQVVVYDSAASAETVFADLSAAVDRCPQTALPGTGGATQHWMREDAGLPGAGSSMTAIAHVTRNGRTTNQALHVLVARVGNALLVLETDGQLAGSESSLDAVDFAQRANAERMIAAMCPFTAEGCGGRPRVTGTGYADLHLGMTAAQVEASAAVKDIDRDTGGACRMGRLVDGGTFYLSRKLGLAAIFLGGTMSTDKGVMLGATPKEVQDAYPQGEWNTRRYWVSPVGRPGGVRVMEFGFDDKDTLVEALLTRSDQDCFG